MRKLLWLIIVSFVTMKLSAQTTDSIKYKYINQSVYRNGSMFQKGTERMGFRDLQAEFSMSELGLDGYRKAKKQAGTSTVLRLFSFAASVAAISVIANNGKRNTAYLLLGGQVVFTFAALKYANLSRSSLDRALWQRNKDLLFPAR